jgi:hypothetical protein
LDLNQAKHGDGWQLRWKLWLLVLGRHFGGYGLVVATDLDFFSECPVLVFVVGGLMVGGSGGGMRFW